MSITNLVAACRSRCAEEPRRTTDPTRELAARSWHLATVLRAISRRRDVLRLRTRIVLMLVEMRCPLGSVPARGSYTPGAVTRMGAKGLIRAWPGRWNEPAPSLRCIRGHIGELIRACVIVRAPGDWLAYYDPAHPERRPRFSDTFHVVEGEDAANWWAEIGRKLLEEHPETHDNPDRWRLVFGTWRAQAKAWAEGRGETAPTAAPNQAAAAQEPSTPTPARMRALARACTNPNAEAFEILVAARGVGARVTGRITWEMGLTDLDRLRGAAAMLWRALKRKTPIRNRAGWLVEVYRGAPPEDRARARRAARESLGNEELAT